MPRAPKHPSLRARRNKASTRAKLRAGGVRAPALPTRGCVCGGPVEPEKPKRRRGPGRPRKKADPCRFCEGSGILPWHHLTQAWWKRLWASPMGAEYLESDIDGLYVAASLVDEFWRSGGCDSKLAGEIRLQLARFGTSPIDRRKLEWELERPEEAQPKEELQAYRKMADPRLLPEVPPGMAN